MGILIFFLALPERKPQIETFSIPPLPAQTLTAEKPKKEYSPPQVVPVEPFPLKTKPFAPIEPINPKSLPLGASPFGRGIVSGHSTLTVDNGTDTDAVVKVIRFKDREQHVRNFYIHQGKKWTAKKIPPGRYVLRVAFGKDWNSKSRMFNFCQSFSESEVLDIAETTSVRQSEEEQLAETQFTELSITLHKVLFGNFKSYEISEENFYEKMGEQQRKLKPTREQSRLLWAYFSAEGWK